LRQSSTRAQTATAIPPSASAMNTQRRVSRSRRASLWVMCFWACAARM
jgi:hypothetical protein